MNLPGSLKSYLTDGCQWSLRLSFKFLGYFISLGRGGAGPDESQGAKHFAKRYDVDRRPDPHPRFLAIYLFFFSD